MNGLWRNLLPTPTIFLHEFISTDVTYDIISIFVRNNNANLLYIRQTTNIILLSLYVRKKTTTKQYILLHKIHTGGKCDTKNKNSHCFVQVIDKKFWHCLLFPLPSFIHIFRSEFILSCVIVLQPHYPVQPCWSADQRTVVFGNTVWHYRTCGYLGNHRITKGQTKTKQNHTHARTLIQ